MTSNSSKISKNASFKEFKQYVSLSHHHDDITLRHIIEKFEKTLGEKDEIVFPLSILSEKLSPFETITKYLVENLILSYSEIGRLLKKDRRVIWTTYKRASSKIKQSFQDKESKYNIPISRLSSDKFSISEIIVGYLKEKGMKNSEIAVIMKRDQRTIWTFLKRYKQKNPSFQDKKTGKTQNITFEEFKHYISHSSHHDDINLRHIIEKFEKTLKEKEKVVFPLSLLSKKLSAFETLVKYLVENLIINYSEVGRLLKKDRRVIWTTYKRASSKLEHSFSDKESKYNIPISRLSSKKFSISELIVGYLKDLGMKNSDIAVIIKRDQRTVWTLYKRYKQKNG